MKSLWVMKFITTVFCVVLLPMVCTSEQQKKPYRALIFAPYGTPSHAYTLMDIARGLAKESVHVTIMVGVKMKPEKNIEVVYNQVTAKALSGVEKETFLRPERSWKNGNIFLWLDFVVPAAATCHLFYEDESVIPLLRNRPHYDVIIVDSILQDCTLPLVHYLGAPFIFFTAGVGDPSLLYNHDIPTPFSYVSMFFSYSTGEPLRFLQRVMNSIDHLTFIAVNRFYFYPRIDAAVKKALPESPPVGEIASNASLVLFAAEGLIAPARPLMPFTIDVGGVQCRPPHPLPPDLKKMANDARNGFIVFSFGSVLDGKFFTPDVQLAFMKAFSRLQQTVIWKYGGSINADVMVPPNVKLLNFLPQQDLLGHPNARLFITHGGVQSFYETLYHGIPIVGMGVFADQKPNVARAVELKIGRELNQHNITEESVFEIVSDVLSNPSYWDNMKKLSGLFRHQPQTPMERAVFWIKYVAEHEGAKHLRPPTGQLNFFQYFLLDVILFIFGILTLALVMLYQVSKIIFAMFKKILSHGKVKTS